MTHKEIREKRKNSRSKGKRGELLARDFLERVTGEKWERTAQRCGKGGTADVRPVDPDSRYARLHIEVKNDPRIGLNTKALDKACNQSHTDSGDANAWRVIWRQKGKWNMTRYIFSESGTLVATFDEEWISLALLWE